MSAVSPKALDVDSGRHAKSHVAIGSWLVEAGVRPSVETPLDRRPDGHVIAIDIPPDS